MNIFQKMFALIVVTVTFGAGAFHVLATFSPVLMDLLVQNKWVGVGLMVSAIVALMVMLLALEKAPKD